ncbi:ThiF family adenylyltransferase [Marinimicrobium sp. ABcell2]|uniref:tRNA threonylcarbamoyladenosine dehydratase n=1 Tax=Marinimicrobium sp. ABcell2 TaxID=3069751 RepID=UPI0027B7DDAE|nr:ThiF family adenylyltransferase [Marinimicrobium sp. ABcell2]MDQ2076639.1 ThiF family adenylyltransferase [Marinimicrobium sp. ABcell2]
MTSSELNPEYLQRFGAIARLYGESALVALSRAHFVVVGLGGVGSWTAEALARSGVGELTLIELDGVCVTNTNRQLHALKPHLGDSKNRVITERLKAINPDLVVHSEESFLTRDNMTSLIDRRHHVVVDAIDSAHVKARLAAYCSAIKLRLVMVGSSGGKRDPGKIKISDLGATSYDPMLRKVRTLLYRQHNFSRDRRRRFGVDAIYSDEQMTYPQPDGSACGEKHLGEGVKLDCGGGLGSVVMVTGSFGLVAAGRAIDRYLEQYL